MLCGPKILDTVSPYRSFMIGSWWHQTLFLNHSDYCFIPHHSLPSVWPFPSPTHPLTISHPFQALEGAPSDQLMQQNQMPQYYAQQPWVPKTSASSFSRPSQLNFCSASSVTPFSCLHHCHQPASVSAVSHCRCFISDGLFLSFTSHQLINRIHYTHGQCNRAARFQNTNFLLMSVALLKSCAVSIQQHWKYFE